MTSTTKILAAKSDNDILAQAGQWRTRAVNAERALDKANERIRDLERKVGEMSRLAGLMLDA
jgi:hypothetical protein